MSHIAKDSTLKNRVTDRTKPVYLVNSDIAVSAAFTIEPGVVIEVNADKKIAINATRSIFSNGTKDKKVILEEKLR